MSRFEEYSERYRNIRLRRRDGILEMTLHTDGEPLHWNQGTNHEFISACHEIGADPENRVVIVTGAGDTFCSEVDYESFGDFFGSARLWDRIYREGRRVPLDFLDVEIPMIAAVNGPARVHPELPVMCDIVLASDTAVFQDMLHFMSGVVPGDGVQVIWPLLLGMNRGRYFLLTGQELSAHEALDLGVVNEVLPRDALLARAWELAEELTAKPYLTLRYSRVLLTQELQRLLRDGVGYGLALEGIAALDATPDSKGG